METPTLLIDCHYLAHRAQYALGGRLSNDQQGTGLLYGFLGQTLTLAHRYGTNRLVFCFDGGCEKRRELYPEYKAGRRIMPEDPVEALDRQEFHRQVGVLREEILPALGFSNVFRVDGYEADDILAWLSSHLPGHKILVTSDHDLYQCLSLSTSMYLSKAPWEYTVDLFIKEHDIAPYDWPSVKALAGCDGDGVPGCPGVGEKTATRYMSGLLKAGSVAYRRCEAFPEHLMNRNLALVRLPFNGFPGVTVQPDRLDWGMFLAVCRDYGFTSFLGGRLEDRWRSFFAGQIRTSAPDKPMGVIRHVPRH